MLEKFLNTDSIKKLLYYLTQMKKFLKLNGNH